MAKKKNPKFQIATSCTPQYLPGFRALVNSLEKNFPEAQLTCFWYPQYSGLYAKDLPKGVDYIINAPMEGHITHNGKVWRDGMRIGPDMYARIMIPRWMTGRVFYIDVDCLVLQEFSEVFDMDLEGHLSACVYRPDIGWEGGNIFDDMASGTFLMDADAWNEHKFIEKIYSVMDDEKDAKTKRGFDLNVESAMSYAHDGNFVHLPADYQNLVYYKCLSKQDKIAHYAGAKPWPIWEHYFDKKEVGYQDLWQAYHDKDWKTVNKIQKALPDERPENAWETRIRW
jgi:lipopolysaccharide biosynthesis glycosyltransferase